MGGVYTESSVSSYMLVLFEFNAVGLIVLLNGFLLICSRDITYRLSIKCTDRYSILDTLVVK